MSYSIEYNRKVYFNETDSKSGEKDYLLLVKQGDNNCRYASNGLRCRDWELIAYGWEYVLWQEIGKRGGYCEGGSLQKADGWDTRRFTIEEYISIYRKAIKNAKSIQEKLLGDFEITLFIHIRKKSIKNIADFDYRKITDLMQKYKIKYWGNGYYDKEEKIYKLNIVSIEQFLDCVYISKFGNYKGAYGSFNFKERK